MKYYLLSQEQINIIESNNNSEYITIVCDYGQGPCIPESDVNSEGREYLKSLVAGQTPIIIVTPTNRFIPEDPD